MSKTDVKKSRISERDQIRTFNQGRFFHRDFN